MRRIGCLLVALLLAAPAAAQHGGHEADQKPAVLFDNLGDYHLPITTRSTEAQKFFDQGLRLLYGFNHAEAARSFRRAARLDPEAAMDWWGLALSIGPNYNDTAVDEERSRATFEAAQKAVALSVKASPREQA